MDILITILAFALGTAGGAFCAFHLARVRSGGKTAPYGIQVLPLLAAALLLLLSLWLFTGSYRMFFSVLLTAFCLVNAGTLFGLKGRDTKLLEMASVFRVPAMARIQYIDLPVCRTSLVRSAQIAGIVSALIPAVGASSGAGGQAYLFRLIAGVLNVAAASAAGIILKKKGGAA